MDKSQDKQCPTCNGLGSYDVWDEDLHEWHTVTCETCKGTGYVPA